MDLNTLEVLRQRIKCVCSCEFENFSELYKHYFNEHCIGTNRFPCDQEGCFWLGTLNTLKNHQQDHRRYYEYGNRQKCHICKVSISSVAHTSTMSHCWNMLFDFAAKAEAPERRTTTEREGVGEVVWPQNKHLKSSDSNPSNPFQIFQARPTTGSKINNTVYWNSLRDFAVKSGAPERQTTTKREGVREVGWPQNKHLKSSNSNPSNPFEISQAKPAGGLEPDDAIYISDGDTEIPKNETGVKRKAAGEVEGSYKHSDIHLLLS